MAKTVQEKFDALIAEHGAEEVIKAIKSHTAPPVHTDGGGSCEGVICRTGYYCSQGVCILNVG